MSAGGERLDNGLIELHTLDVGQADATVIITEDGQIVLNDADEDEITDSLGSVLADRTVERTDNGTIPLVFATTHLHRDHIEGLNSLYLTNTRYHTLSSRTIHVSWSMNQKKELLKTHRSGRDTHHLVDHRGRID